MTDTPAPPKPKRRWTRPLKIAGAALGGLVVLAGLAGTVAVLSFDPDAFKPRIIAAVREATGRELVLEGPIGVKLSLWPTIEAKQVALSNPPGFSRPYMATLGKLDLHLGLTGLLHRRIDVDRLDLVEPDILLETDAAGRPNWVFTRPPKPAVPDASPGAAAAASGEGASDGGLLVDVRGVRITKGHVAFRDGTTGRVTDLALARLAITTKGMDSPVTLAAEGTLDGAPLRLSATTGSYARLLDPAATAPWPVAVEASLGGATAKVQGTLTAPLRFAGYELGLSGTVPDTDIARRLVGAPTIPRARDVTFALRARDIGQPWPEVADLKIAARGIELGTTVPGLVVTTIDLGAPKASEPVSLRIAGQYRGVAVTLGGMIGRPGWLGLDGGAGGPVPVDVTAEAAGARVVAKGQIGDLRSLTGVSLALSATVPDLAALSPLAQERLPPLKSLGLTAQLADAGSGLRAGVRVTSLALTGPEGDVSGEVTFVPGVPASLTARLASQRLDVDALKARLAETPPPPPAASPAPAAAPAPTPAPAPAPSQRVFSDQPLRFGELQRLDADVVLAGKAIRIGGADVRNFAATIGLRDGKLRIDPLTAEAPEGRISAKLTVDATLPAPAVTLTAHAPGLAAKALLSALGAPPVATGRAEAYADLKASGETPRALAASLRGSAGLALAGGTLDTKVIGGSLGRLYSDLQILDAIGRGGDANQLQCLAVRFDAQDGVARARTMVLSSSLVTADGGGSINLRDETMNLLIRPQGRVGATEFRVPIRVSGPLRRARAVVDPSGAAEANAEGLVGIIIGNTTPLGVLGGLLGTDKLYGDPKTPCPAALRIARGEAPPAAPTSVLSDPASALPDVGNIFRKLFR